MSSSETHVRQNLESQIQGWRSARELKRLEEKLQEAEALLRVVKDALREAEDENDRLLIQLRNTRQASSRASAPGPKLVLASDYEIALEKICQIQRELDKREWWISQITLDLRTFFVGLSDDIKAGELPTFEWADRSLTT